MAVVAELAKLSNEPTGATNNDDRRHRAPAPGTPWAMTPEQATAALAQKTAEYQAAQATAAGAVAPPPPGVQPTTPAQAASTFDTVRSATRLARPVPRLAVPATSP